MAWADFSCLTTDVQTYLPNILSRVDSDVLENFIAVAQAEVESERLLPMVYQKFNKLGYTLPDDLPAEPLDTILASAFPSIRRLIIFRALYYVFATVDIDQAEMWEKQYRSAGIDQVLINIDVDESGTIETAEHISYQGLLDSRER